MGEAKLSYKIGRHAGIISVAFSSDDSMERIRNEAVSMLMEIYPDEYVGAGNVIIIGLEDSY